MHALKLGMATWIFTIFIAKEQWCCFIIDFMPLQQFIVDDNSIIWLLQHVDVGDAADVS
jgi:hypothetical protein